MTLIEGLFASPLTSLRSLATAVAAVVEFDGRRARVIFGKMRRSEVEDLEIELRQSGCSKAQVRLKRNGSWRFSRNVDAGTRERISHLRPGRA